MCCSHLTNKVNRLSDPFIYKGAEAFLNWDKMIFFLDEEILDADDDFCKEDTHLHTRELAS